MARKIQTGKVVEMTNPFDAIAKPKEAVAATKKSGIPNAATNEEMIKAVDELIKVKAKLAELEALKAGHEETIVSKVAVEQESDARKGNYHKSYYVNGSNDSKVTYTTVDKFSAVKADTIEALKACIGETKYTEWFEKKRTVTLVEGALANAALVAKLMKAIETSGMAINEVFNVVDTVVAKPGLDEKQFGLAQERLQEFRSLVKQNKASLK